MVDYSKVFHAFTVRFNRRANILYSKVNISLPFDPSRDGGSAPELLEFDAIWDTGASMSTITKSNAQKLGLKPSGKTNVKNTSQEELRDTYLVNVYLPNKVVLPYVTVVECESLVGNFGFLVGMDIIGSGDFSVTSLNDKTVMSYRIPSVAEVDYVEEAELIKRQREIYGRVEEEARKRKANLNNEFLKRRKMKQKARRRKRGHQLRRGR